MKLQSWESFGLQIEQTLSEISWSGHPKELYEPISYTLSLGGKRVRPVLCMLSAQLFQGDLSKAIHAAIGIEIFHNFTLVHDDIMDEAPLRRGMTTVHEKWNRDVAILSGDVMLVKAYEQLLKGPSEHLHALLQLFNKTAIEVCEGQQLDMNFEKEAVVELAAYIRMIELKTAVLLACSLKAGAIIAGASQKEADLIYDFGRNIGIAFQIQDDYLDAYADPDKFGKRVGGDILCNKKTYLLLAALEQATPHQKTGILELMHADCSADEKVDRMLSFYNDLNVPLLAKNSMEDFYKLGMDALAKINTSQALKQPLVQLADQLMQRAH